MASERRVVVTGIGIRTPIGHTLEALGESMREGRSGVVHMDEWEQITNLRSHVAGVCPDIDETALPRQVRRTMGRVAILAALAAKDAVTASGLPEDLIASPATGVSFGSTEGSSQALEVFLGQILQNRSLKGMKSSSYLQFMSHTCAANLAIMFKVKGPVVASCTACVSGSQGIGFGCQQIRAGLADVMLSGGAEEMHFMSAGVFDIMRATSTRYNERPQETPRPFDADRDGLVVGEGAGCFVLEEREHARRRGAPILAEVLGYGTNCDGLHLTNPSSEGMAGAMRAALADAGLSADAIEHVNAHATATHAGDIAESKATWEVFGDRAPVSALKGFMGHTLGAAGAIESAATVAMMRQGFMAPSKNLQNPAPDTAPINHVIGPPREARFHIGMNNNFAFGGINTSLIFKV
jgi:3-oxoacyl-[acyl-carrier-protein] synthase II